MKWDALHGQTVVISNRSNVAESIYWIKKVITETRHNESFKLSTAYLKTPKQIFDFAYNSMVYQPDPDGVQQIKLPIRAMVDGTGNCVDYSVLISSILLNNNIEHKLRVVSFTTAGAWEHIYVVLNDGTVLDPVIGQKQDGTDTRINRPQLGSFNKECNYNYKRDYPMKLQVLAGTRINGKPLVNRLSGNASRLGFLCVTNCDCKKQCEDLFPGDNKRIMGCKQWCDKVNAKKSGKVATQFCQDSFSQVQFGIKPDCSPITAPAPGTGTSENNLYDISTSKGTTQANNTNLILISAAALVGVILLTKKKRKK